MHLLKIQRMCIITLLCLIPSCKPDGPITPEDAFNRLRESYMKDDAESIEHMLSGKSREKISRIINMIKRMDKRQIKALSSRFNLSVDKLKDLTVKDYITLQLSLGKDIGGDTIREIINSKIIWKDVRNNQAVIRVENGMELNFEKEGPYWRLDIRDL